MTVVECRRLTKERFGDEIDYDYITQELLDADAAQGEASIITKALGADVYYGNNPRLQPRTVNRVVIQGTLLDYDGNGQAMSGACGSSKSGWFDPKEWVQTSLGTCPNGRFKFRMS